jgi:hypothetical protein
MKIQQSQNRVHNGELANKPLKRMVGRRRPPTA